MGCLNRNPFKLDLFLLPLTWLVLFILIWIGGKIADHFFGKKESTFYWSEVLFEATLLFLIFLKLSPILWNPQVLIDRPITLLYGFGSSGGGVLAMLFKWSVYWVEREKNRRFLAAFT